MSNQETDRSKTPDEGAGREAGGGPRILHQAGRLWFWIAVSVILYGPFIDTEVGQGNVASDLAAIDSLVARGTFFINESPFAVTLDKFKREELYFSQKSPIFHLAGAVPAWVMARLGWPLAEHAAAGLRVLTLLMVILPMGWLLHLIHRNPWVARLGAGRRLAVTTAFAAGSLLTPFAVTFNHYIAASAFLMAAFNLILARGTRAGGAGDEMKDGARTGLFISLSIACDIPPAFLFGVGYGAWLLAAAVRDRTRVGELAGIVMGAIPIAIFYAGLNWHILGSPLPPNMHEREMLYYEGSFWAEQQAKIARGEPDYYEASFARRVLHATVGFKGIYWMMPLLALAGCAAIRAMGRGAANRAALIAVLAFPVATILVVMRWALDHGGGQYVIRHVFAAVPPLYCALGLAGDWWKSRAFSWVLRGSAAWGFMMALIGWTKPWSHNVLSAFPPVENLARVCLAHPETLPTGWIGGAIARTSVTPANGWLDLGLEHMGLRRLAEAEEAFKKAIAADARFTLAYYHLGIALDMQNRPREAAEVYGRLLELEPGNTGAWNNLGIFHLRAGDGTAARRAFEKSLDTAPDNLTALWGMLVIEKGEGRASPDSALLRKALELYPDDPRIQEIAKSFAGER